MDKEGFGNSKERKSELDQNILNYIKKELKKGFSEDLIRDSLIKIGHNPMHVDMHFKLLKSKNQSKLLTYLLILFVVLFILSIIFNVVLYNKIPLRQRYEELVYEGKDLCSDGKYERAFKKLEKAMRLDDKSAFAYAIYGYCYSLQGKFQEAVVTLTQATRRDPTNPLHFHGLGVAYCNLSSYNLGIANIKRAIELNPATPEFHKSIAECYSKAGNKEESEKHLKIINAIASINLYDNLI